MLSFAGFGQADSGTRASKDTVAAKTDSSRHTALDSLQHDSAARRVPLTPLVISWDDDTAFERVLTVSFNTIKIAVAPQPAQQHISKGKDELFYILAGLFLLLGLTKTAYPKYFQNLFRLFFQASLRQKQTPEQITQGYVPGLMLTVLFFLVGGMFISIYGMQQRWFHGPVWLLMAYSSLILASIYIVKYLFTLFTGWVFNASYAASTYSFIIFLINRVMGIVLLPVLVLLAFYGNGFQTVVYTVALTLVVFLIIYRYILSLTVIRKNLRIGALHFFIYLCAVELMPLLVIYKVLFNQLADNK